MIALLVGCSSHENPDSPGLGRIRFVASVETDPSAPINAPVALTLSTKDGVYSHTWSNVEDFPTYEGFYEGQYTAKGIVGTEGSEGFDCPCYTSEVDFCVKSGETSTVDLRCTLSQAKLRVLTSETLTTAYPMARLALHSEGYGYIEVSTNETRPIYLSPGVTTVAVTLAKSDGQPIIIDTGLTFATAAGKDYTINTYLTDTGKTLVVECGDKTSTVELTDQLFNAAPPRVRCVGFDDGIAVNLTEGLPANVPLIMEAASGVGFKSLMLTILSDDQLFADVPRECDLLSPDCKIMDYGLKVEEADGVIKVNYTTLLETISVGANSDISFVLQAYDRLGRLSTPTTLSARIHKVDISVAEVAGAVIGINRANVALGINVPQVEVSDFSVYLDDQGQPGRKLEVVDARLDESTHKVVLGFIVPAGINSVDVHIWYMDNAKVQVSVPRIVPQYRLVPDAFAATVRLRVIADKPEIESELTRHIRLYCAGAELSINERNTDEGLLICTGLKPDTRYAIEAVIVEGSYVAQTTFVTEAAAQIPDGDFEDAVESINYKHIASGGVYSSTAFPIFNQQNFKDIKIYFPKKYWASTNAKTFCSHAKRHNTWYMQPSAEIDFDERASGSKSMRVTSVGWSLDGPEIVPYLQEPDTYQPYSGNVPLCQYISAGYVFLGSYTFNPETMTETLDQGISFGSRPSSLNGFYKYIPVADNINDCGWIKVQVINVSDIGTETVIATGEMRFTGAPFFKAFNLPLVYGVYNMKASKVKIMFCSSAATDALALDDPSVPVSANVPEARFTGSALWIDNLSFSY